MDKLTIAHRLNGAPLKIYPHPKQPLHLRRWLIWEKSGKSSFVNVLLGWCKSKSNWSTDIIVVDFCTGYSYFCTNLMNKGSWDKNILNYLALNPKTSILIRHRRENTEKKGKGQVKTATLIRAIHSQAKEYRKPLEAGRRKEFSPGSFRVSSTLSALISEFQPLELWDNQFLWLNHLGFGHLLWAALGN